MDSNNTNGHQKIGRRCCCSRRISLCHWRLRWTVASEYRSDDWESHRLRMKFALNSWTIRPKNKQMDICCANDDASKAFRLRRLQRIHLWVDLFVATFEWKRILCSSFRRRRRSRRCNWTVDSRKIQSENEPMVSGCGDEFSTKWSTLSTMGFCWQSTDFRVF